MFPLTILLALGFTTINGQNLQKNSACTQHSQCQCPFDCINKRCNDNTNPIKSNTKCNFGTRRLGGKAGCPGGESHSCASASIGTFCDCDCDCTNAFCDKSNPSDKKCKAHTTGDNNKAGCPGGDSHSCASNAVGAMCDCDCDCTNAFCDKSNPNDKKCKAHGGDAGGSPSGSSSKCTGYGCAGNSVLKSDANTIDRGTNAQGNCCFDSKCSNNPGLSPTNYNCAQHGKQLRPEAQNINRAGGAGEQTNCCEATGSSTTSTCVSSSFICQGGSVATAHAKCAASVCVESEFSSASGRCCESPSSSSSSNNKCTGNAGNELREMNNCSWTEMYKCSTTQEHKWCTNDYGIKKDVEEDLCYNFLWNSPLESKIKSNTSMTEDEYCRQGTPTKLGCFYRCCKWDYYTTECSSLERTPKRVENAYGVVTSVTCDEPDKENTEMNLMCRMPSNGGLSQTKVIRCLDEDAAGCVKLNDTDTGRGGLFIKQIDTDLNTYSCSAGHATKDSSDPKNRCMNSGTSCSAMEGDVVTMGMALTLPVRGAYIVEVDVTIDPNYDTLKRMHTNASTGINLLLSKEQGCRFESGSSSLQLHYNWKNWYVPQRVTTAPLYDDDIDQGFRGMRTFGCTIKTTMTVRYVSYFTERIILTKTDEKEGILWDGSHVLDNYNFVTSSVEKENPKSWFANSTSNPKIVSHLTSNVTIWVGNDDTAGFSLLEGVDSTDLYDMFSDAHGDIGDGIGPTTLTLALQQDGDPKVFGLRLNTKPWMGDVVLEMLLTKKDSCPPFNITRCKVDSSNGKTVGLPLCFNKLIYHPPFTCQTTFPLVNFQDKSTPSSWNATQYFQVQPVNITKDDQFVFTISYNGKGGDKSFKKVKNQTSKLILEITKSKISKICGNNEFLYVNTTERTELLSNSRRRIMTTPVCWPCPEGGNCNGEKKKFDEITTLADWWIIPESERIDKYKPFAKCIAPNACLAGVTFQNNNTCAFNRKNGSRLCNACKIGWVRTSQGQCSKCNVGEENGHWTLIIIIIGVMVAIAFYSTLLFLRVKAFRNFDKDRRRKAHHSTLKRILISHFHTLNLIMLTSDAWPPLLKEVTSAFTSPVSFSEGTNSFDCFNHPLNSLGVSEGESVQHSVFYYKILLSAFLVPLGLVALLALFWFALAPLCCKIRQRSLCHVEATPTLDSSSSGSLVKFIPSDADAFISSVMMLWFLLLPSILRICFQAFECISVPTTSYLVLDLERPCNSSIHLSYSLGVAIPCIIIWVVFVPIFVLQRLNSKGHPERDTNPSLMLRWGIMHSGYRHEKFYWEATVVYLRKLCMVLVVTFATSSRVKLHMALAILIISLHLHDAHHPFGHTKDGQGQRMLHRFETWSLLMMIMMAWNGVLFEFGVCTDKSSQVMCKILLAVGLIGNIGFLVVLLGRCLNECRKRNRVRKKCEKYARACARGCTKKKPDDEEQGLQIEMVNPARGAALKS